MKTRRRWIRRLSTTTLIAVLLMAGATPVHGAQGSAGPDRETLSRLRAVQTPNGEVLLLGAPVTIAAAHPDRVFLPVLVFNLGKDRPVTVREITVTGPDGSLLAAEHPSQRVIPAVEGGLSREAALARVADRVQGHAAAFAKPAHVAFQDGIPATTLALADGTETTLTVHATVDIAGERSVLAMPLRVTVAALPSVASWYAGDGHVHSSTWSDGLYSLDAQVSRAKSDGQAFVIMTDHWSKIWSRKGGGNANWATYHDECTSAQLRRGMPVLPGVELMSASRQGHALGYALGRAAVPPKDEYWMPVDLINRIASHTPSASFAAVAHPFQTWPNTPWSDWTARGFRAIELMSNERVASDRTIATWFSQLRSDVPGVIGGGRFVVGMANTDDHFNNPGGNGVNWIRSTAHPLTTAAVWDALRLGRVSASGRKDLGYFTLNGVQQGGVIAATPTTRLTFTIVQQPVTGRTCTGVSIRDRNNAVVWATRNPNLAVLSTSIAVPASDAFYVVKMDFAKSDGTEPSHVWCNPVFVDRK